MKKFHFGTKLFVVAFVVFLLFFIIINIPIRKEGFLSVPVSHMPVQVMNATWVPFTDGCRILELQPVRMLENNVPEVLHPEQRPLLTEWCPDGTMSFGTHTFLPEVFVLSTSSAQTTIINPNSPFSPERIPKISGDNMATIIGAAKVVTPRIFFAGVGLEIFTLLAGLLFFRKKLKIALSFFVISFLIPLWYGVFILSGSTVGFALIATGFITCIIVLFGLGQGSLMVKHRSP